MEKTQLIGKIIDAVENLIPFYMKHPIDSMIAKGNVSICIIDEQGNVYGKMFGSDRIRQRESFRVAWVKASQVHITGVRTMEYERQVFTGEIPENHHGISAPDLIGWEGGQPVTLEDGTMLSIGFSGFRGTSDIEIVQKAIAEVTGNTIE